MPCIQFVNGVPVFWDSCANLYNAIGGTSFTEKELDCYDHVNSATFYDEMLNEVEDKEAFKNQHLTAAYNPEQLRGFWKSTVTYYQKHKL